jgi:diadenosine tetraphosphate (Ap4A) HIT family hydrolase
VEKIRVVESERYKMIAPARVSPKAIGYSTLNAVTEFSHGKAAGQTVMRFHCHVIPRYFGDVKDPRGGVRHSLPGRGNYLVDKQIED